MVFERWNAIMISFLGLGENHPAKKGIARRTSY